MAKTGGDEGYLVRNWGMVRVGDAGKPKDWAGVGAMKNEIEITT